ncbi:MAG: Acetyltransferase domain [Planctomycetota bacterium]
MTPTAPAPLRLRPFAAADAVAVVPWLRAPGLALPPGPAAQTWGQRLVADARVAAWVVELGEEPCAFLRLDLGPDRVAEVTIAVAPNRRRKGIGARALAQLVREARSLGVLRLQALVDPGHPEAMEFFAEQGFEANEPPVCGRIRFQLLLHASDGNVPLDIVP